MMDEQSIFARIFSNLEIKKLGCGAILIFLTIELTLFSVFKLPIWGLQQSVTSGLKVLLSFQIIGEPQNIYSKTEMMKAVSNFSNSMTDAYEIHGDIRIVNNSSTIFMTSSLPIGNLTSWTVRPIAIKFDNLKIGPVREWNVTTLAKKFPDCSRRYEIPAILFSTGSFAGNYFHDFDNVLIPLYLTSRQFNGTVVFLATNHISWWKSKYEVILDKLSDYDVVDMDKENEVLCFSRMFVGLKANKEFGIDPLESPNYTMKNFREFLRSTYSLKRGFAHDCHKIRDVTRPRMLIISRKNSRRLRNEGEISQIAKGLGFDVVLKEMESNLTIVSQCVNSFDVIMGVHGAGLTNMLFLPDNAVVIQITPISLEWPSYRFFGFPTKGMNLKYLEYKVSPNESSLLERYPYNSEVFTNPHAIRLKGISLFNSIYLYNQDVILDLDKFREVLLNALKLLHC